MTAIRRITAMTRRALRSPRQVGRAAAIAIVAMMLVLACGSKSPNTFREPDQAIEALSAALSAEDQTQLENLFGPGSLEHLQSGDEVADREDSRRVVELIGEGVTWTDLDDHTKVANLGKDPWPFPFPLVSEDGRWRFDLDTGIDELHSRRIGRNEISTIATLHAYVDAQREYWRARPLGDPPRFAQYFMSREGERNGLYWPTKEGEEPSPLGELVAEAALEGYQLPEGAEAAAAATDAGQEGEPQAYQGYHFRILTAQGDHASGGAGSYLDDQGLMRTGFAAVAWPTSYGNSGVMTLMVNQFGIVFQKDLGEETETVAQAMTVYDPDETWTPTGD
jgi:hypothetical protein